jgi:hypothetical protein
MVPETAGGFFYNYTRGAEVGGRVCGQSAARRVVEMRHSPLLVGKRLIGPAVLSYLTKSPRRT